MPMGKENSRPAGIVERRIQNHFYCSWRCAAPLKKGGKGVFSEYFFGGFFKIFSYEKKNIKVI
jgi:hypothetical protein